MQISKVEAFTSISRQEAINAFHVALEVAMLLTSPARDTISLLRKRFHNFATFGGYHVKL
jgi:hypothetical protein